jgi:hypothetical protein
MELTLPVELTKSRTGLHARRSVIVILGHNRQEVISKPVKPGKGTYSRGEAGTVTVTLNKGEVAVLASLTMGSGRGSRGSSWYMTTLGP